MNPLIQVKKASAVFLIALACFGLAPSTHALLPPPPPDGGYPGNNTAEGTNALFNLTTGANNTAVGFDALISNTTGNNNTATGIGALGSNTIGNDNTANGFGALLHDTTGSDNTALGFEALLVNTTGFQNTANGWRALFANTTGFHNTADGFIALSSNTTGNHNTADGDEALTGNTTGNSNTTCGAHSLIHNTTGSGNTVLGFDTGNSIITANNVICIGENVAGANVSNSCFIGNIFGSTSANGVAVFVNSNGGLGTMTSSARFKDQIKPMDKASETLYSLKPVAFRYKQEIDPKRTPQFGLVAEDVEEVNPDLVVRDKEGEPYSVRYDQVNAMLLNEFLKEHRAFIEERRKVEKLEATVAQQHKDFEAALIDLNGQIQRVSTQLELSKATPQTAENKSVNSSRADKALRNHRR
jgi:Chaperone of endosialidase